MMPESTKAFALAYETGPVHGMYRGVPRRICTYVVTREHVVQLSQ